MEAIPARMVCYYRPILSGAQVVAPGSRCIRPCNDILLGVVVEIAEIHGLVPIPVRGLVSNSTSCVVNPGVHAGEFLLARLSRPRRRSVLRVG